MFWENGLDKVILDTSIFLPKTTVRDTIPELNKEFLRKFKTNRKFARYIERRNGTIKNDFLLYSETSINNICQLRKALRIAVYRYNHEVVQAKLGYRTPVMYEAWIASLPPGQRPVK